METHSADIQSQSITEEVMFSGPSYFIAVCLATVAQVSGCEFGELESDSYLSCNFSGAQQSLKSVRDISYYATTYANVCQVQLPEFESLGGTVKLKMINERQESYCDLVCKGDTCVITLAEQQFGLLYEPEFVIDYCTNQGELARVEFKFRFQAPKLKNDLLSASAASFRCYYEDVNCTSIELRIEPNNYNETIEIVGPNDISLGNLMPNKSYQLHSRIRNENRNWWSPWSSELFTTHSEPPLILGYDTDNGGVVYIESNKWTVVSPPEISAWRPRLDNNNAAAQMKCISVIKDLHKFIVAWSSELHTSDRKLILRLIWSKRVGRNNVFLAHHKDVNLIDSTTYHLQSTDNDFSIGYSLITDNRPSIINWLPIQYFPGILSVLHIFYARATNIHMCQSTVSWKSTNCNDSSNIVVSNGWAIELDLLSSKATAKKTIQISPESLKIVGEDYKFKLDNLWPCSDYQGVVVWNSSVRSCPFSFRTSKPEFAIFNLSAVASEHDISLHWSVLPYCSYDTGYYKLYLNGDLYNNSIHQRARSFKIESLEHHSVYNVVIQSCYQDTCLSNVLSIRTTTAGDISLSVNVDLNTQISVTCSTPDNVDFYLYSVRDQNGKVLKEDQRDTCAFQDSCRYPQNTSIYLKAGIRLTNGSVILSKETKLSLDFSMCSTSVWGLVSLIIFAVLLTIVGLVLLIRHILMKLEQKRRMVNIILPIELELLEEKKQGHIIGEEINLIHSHSVN